LLALALLSCEPTIPTGHSEGINTGGELNVQYKMLMYKQGDKYLPFNPPLLVNIQDSMIVMTNRSTILNKFILIKPLVRGHEGVENGVKKVLNVNVYKCILPDYLNISEDVYAISTKYKVDSNGNRTLEHISIENRLQTYKTYMYE
jgi:hypothetical protein